jgi:hemolysin activation/secretion protein
VLAVRAQAALSNARLPDAERALLGGGASLRGYHAGHRAGDNLVAVAAELRVPITSPLSVARAGVKAFADAGTVWSSGERLRGRAFERGAGVGVYAGAAAFIAAIDVAWPETGKPRIHASLGVAF